VRGLIGGDCHARRYRLSTGARAGRLPVSDLDYVVCTDSVPVQQERHDLRFPGLGQRKEVPCLCGGVTALHKIRSYNNYNTYRQPASFGSSALDVSRLPGPPQADSGRQRASRARTNDRKTSLPFIASGFTLRFSLLCSAMSGGSAVLGIPATSTVCAGLLFGFWSFFGIRGVVEC
jgi:hypothetical protein